MTKTLIQMLQERIAENKIRLDAADEAPISKQGKSWVKSTIRAETKRLRKQLANAKMGEEK